MNKDELIKKLEEGTLTTEEWNDLDEVLKSNDEIDITHEINQMAENIDIPATKTKKQAWEEVSAEFDEDETTEPFATNKRLVYGAISGIAASVLLITWWVFLRTVNVSTGPGEMAMHTLPDGSTVELNAQSSISYKPFGFEDLRIITQEGEAFFKVRPGKNFEVKFGGSIVRVLGTSFNIYSRQGVQKVDCSTGKVRVISAENDVILTTGLSTQLQGKAFNIPYEINQIGTWRQGEFYFENESLQTVFAAIERQFNVKVQLSDQVATQIYTGRFRNKNLEQALQLVCVPMGLSFTINENQTVLIQR